MMALATLALLVGASLGLLGGGGSILTVPLLTGVGGLGAKSAIATSLFVVGVTSAFAALSHARRGNVRWRIAVWFGGASMIGAYTGARLAAFIPGTVLLLLFSVAMVVTALAMFRERTFTPQPGGLRPLKVLAEGAAVGLFTGMVGAGGGFLVVPALVLLGGLQMHVAVGTSLAVIAMKSGAGLVGYLSHVEMSWSVAALVTVFAVLGSFIGGRYADRIEERVLRRIFAGFVLVLGFWVFFSTLL